MPQVGFNAKSRTDTDICRVEYAVKSLNDYIRKILETVMGFKESGTDEPEISEGVVLRAIKFHPLRSDSTSANLYSTSSQLMQDESIAMYIDEISSSDASSFEDSRVEEEDLNHFLNEISDDYEEGDENLDDHAGLNELIKVSLTFDTRAHIN